MKFAKKEKKVLSTKSWNLLIVDDEEEVHTITKSVLKKFDYKNKGIIFHSAYCVDEALEILKNNKDIDVILLDVVMESDDAGLILVQKIREDLKNKDVRIILRTGQPGLYPPKDIIVDYDIDDYKEKTELTSAKLFITIISALKTREFILTIEKHNLELEERVKKEIEKNRKKDTQIVEQRRLAQMGEMISMIAHQWRQPLAAIGSTSSTINLKAMINKLDSKTAIELSNKISDFSQQLSSTIDDFSNFFRQHKQEEKTTLTNIITTTIDIIEDRLTNQGITIETNLIDDDEIVTYASEIKQVVLNLLENSKEAILKHNQKHGCIKIKTYKVENHLCLNIEDNGNGIPQNIMSNIFDPYFSTKQEKTGTGLGLYMSKIIIEEHCNGVLTIQNTNHGAISTIKLPQNSKKG